MNEDTKTPITPEWFTYLDTFYFEKEN